MADSERDRNEDTNSMQSLRENATVPSCYRSSKLTSFRIWTWMYFLSFAVIPFALGWIFWPVQTQNFTESVSLPAFVDWWTFPLILVIVFLLPLLIGSYLDSVRPSYWLMYQLRWRFAGTTRFLLRRSTTIFFILSIGIPSLYYFGIGNATAVATIFYASVLLFKEILLEDTPVLKFVTDDEEYSRDSDKGWFTYSYGIQNEGSADASSISVSYRVYDSSGKPITDVENAIIPPRHLSLPTGDTIPAEEIFIPVPMEAENMTSNKLYIHLKAEDGFGYSLIPARERISTSIGTE